MFWRGAGPKLVDNLAAYHTLEGKSGIFTSLVRSWRKARHDFLSLVTASDINLNARVAPSSQLPHPNGIVMHGTAVVGENCMIMQQVTLGQTGDNKAPTLGNNVYVGAGAKLLGDITIRDGARIGANAVVLSDVPAGTTAVGVPAKIKSSP